MDIVTIVISIVSSIVGSQGLLYWIMSRKDKKREAQQKKDAAESAETKMLLGLGHDRIIHLCMKYIERGWISSDEHEDLIKYLYEPYVKLNGNGTAKRLVEEVNRLPVHNMTYLQQAHREAGVS